MGCLLGPPRALLESGQDPYSCPGPQEACGGHRGEAVTCYQVHGVHLDGVLLGVPLSGHGNGQGLTGDSEGACLGRPQLPVVQVDLEATLKDRTETSQVDRQSGVITSLFGYLI